MHPETAFARATTNFDPNCCMRKGNLLNQITQPIDWKATKHKIAQHHVLGLDATEQSDLLGTAVMNTRTARNLLFKCDNQIAGKPLFSVMTL